ncbi:MAG: cysteine--tRNA ligase [Myxococcota bacterium]
MSIKVYNTKNRRKEEFVPIHDGEVRMYVCGITPYDLSHIGHARAYIAFDVIYRYFKFRGYKTIYCRNYTNIDDKIIKRANELGETPAALSERFIEEYRRDMRALNVATPDIEPRVTEEIETIIEMIKKIEENGHAYTIGGDVYFDIDSFRGYGKLSGRNIEELIAGARVEVDERKKNPLDFALWKSAKPGEPAWDSPWGKGRPGWHIECSAMSQKYLGVTFDIHGGGKDLVFPHHENEIAQSEAAYKQTSVNYWLHNGFVNVDSEKMSKSLGNFFTIQEVLGRYHPEIVRYFILTTHYRSPINFSDKTLDDAAKRVDYHFETIKRAKDFLAVHTPDGKPEVDVIIKEVMESFIQAMDDDFNAPLALGSVQEFFKAINEAIDGKGVYSEYTDGKRASAVKELSDNIALLGGVLGMWLALPEEYLASRQEALKRRAESGLSAEEVERLIAERASARKSKDFKRSDEIRDMLAARGIEIKDTPQGTEWKYKK